MEEEGRKGRRRGDGGVRERRRGAVAG